MCQEHRVICVQAMEAACDRVFILASEKVESKARGLARRLEKGAV